MSCLKLRLAFSSATRTGVAVSFAAWSLAAAPAAQAKSQTDPLLKLRHFDAEIRLAVAPRPAGWSPEASARQGRQGRIDHLLRDLLDYEEIAHRALGDSFATLPPEQQHEFVELFSAVTSQTFLAKIDDQQTPTSFESQEIRGNEASVKGHGTCGSAQTDVEYLLERRGGDWQVTDVVIDGSSLVASYQDQFRPLVAREGVAGLIARMRNRLSSDGN
jgi:ABC-type transporter MlaC component